MVLVARAALAGAELGRLDAEPLLYEAGVDLVLSGHLHAYERSHPAFNGTANRCGPVYLNLGDGGNREGAPPGRYFEPPPDWSAFREASFGIGSLVLHNATHAELSWHRSAARWRGGRRTSTSTRGAPRLSGAAATATTPRCRRGDRTRRGSCGPPYEFTRAPTAARRPTAAARRGGAGGVEEVEEVAREGAPAVRRCPRCGRLKASAARCSRRPCCSALRGRRRHPAAGAVRAAARRRRPRAPPSVGWSAPYVRVEE